MKPLGYWLSALAAAVAGGVVVTILLLTTVPWLLAVQTSGPWIGAATSGSPDADPYTRALTAVRGLLALNREETIYFTAHADSQGRSLSGDCTYRLAGHDLPARWWSITTYGPDSYLIDNPQGEYSISQTAVERDPDGRYTALISAEPSPGNWLPASPGEGFTLTARLYNPEPRAYRAPAEIELPHIERVACS